MISWCQEALEELEMLNQVFSTRAANWAFDGEDPRHFPTNAGTVQPSNDEENDIKCKNIKGGKDIRVITVITLTISADYTNILQ